MAIDAKFTRTLPAPTATISNGFVFLLSAGWFTDADLGVAGSPIDGGVNSIANGGGDMQVFSDTAATTRLPIEVVSFVTGGIPEAQVWVRTPSYTSGDTITIGRDDTQTIQPAVGAAFGRNSVWVDYEVVCHHETITPIDSTGNTTLTTSGTLVQVTGAIGEANTFNGDSVDTGEELTNPVNFTLQSWKKGTVSDRKIAHLHNGSSTSGSHYIDQRGGSLRFVVDNTGSGVVVGSAINANDVLMHGVYDSGVALLYEDGALSNSRSYTKTSTGLDKLSIGSFNNSAEFFTGDLDETRLRYSALAASHVSSEHSNQFDPDNFGTSSEWVLVGGDGISGTITQTISSFTQSLAGTIVNPTTTGTINQTTQSFTQAAIGTSLLNITGTITQSASAFTQSLSGNVTENITGVINQGLSSFTQSLLGSVSIPVTGNINQTASSFTQSAVGVVPIQWTDKAPVSTAWTNQAETVINWTVQSGVSTIWTDKV
tara:strand:- start:4617 stop:6071 length:1455 start_codon:yes stop_codon:yes gene_type:complete